MVSLICNGRNRMRRVTSGELRVTQRVLLLTLLSDANLKSVRVIRFIMMNLLVRLTACRLASARRMFTNGRVRVAVVRCRRILIRTVLNRRMIVRVTTRLISRRRKRFGVRLTCRWKWILLFARLATNLLRRLTFTVVR